jgi:hypothetical protein
MTDGRAVGNSLVETMSHYGTTYVQFPDFPNRRKPLHSTWR